MTELYRLSKTSPNPLTRTLLASARDDAPSSGARLSAAMAIGIAGGLAATATAGGAAAGTATGTAAGTATTGTIAASKWIGAATLVKLVGATVASGALVVGVVQEQRHLAAPAPPPPSVQAVAAFTRARPAMPARPAPATIDTAPNAPVPFEAPPTAAVAAPTPLMAPPQVTRMAHPVVARPSAARSAVAPDDATLRDEVDRLDRVHALITQGRAEEALASLAAYERAFPRRALGDEAELLRIEALAQSGDAGAAMAHAERLLARDEYGPHARRVRALLASLRSGAGAP